MKKTFPMSFKDLIIHRKKNYYECPKCHQDMRANPHDGLKGKDCSLCGQGINWREAKRLEPRISEED